MPLIRCNGAKAEATQGAMGDKVTVTITGPTAIYSDGCPLYILDEGVRIVADGTITEDRGDDWVVRLKGRLWHRSYLILPKDRVLRRE